MPLRKGDHVICPGCSGQGRKTALFGVYDCESCGGLLAEHVYLGESYTLVKPTFCGCNPAPAPEATRYYDITALGSKGLERRHGWYHVACKGITQTG